LGHNLPNVETIEDKGELLAIVYRDADWTPGLTFCTPDSLAIQAGCWFYPAGKKLAAHYHNVNERQARKTQEVTYVKRGRMKATVFDTANKPVREIVLHAGDFAVFVNGGHGYEILEDGTQILEVKNGPFTDVQTDKTLF